MLLTGVSESNFTRFVRVKPHSVLAHLELTGSDSLLEAQVYHFFNI
jgi:hypothetical protein